jgi:hypothetical protein
MRLSLGSDPAGVAPSLVDALVLLQSSRLSHAIAKANHMLVAGLQIVHVFGLILLLGPLILIGLRVLGLVLREQPLEDIVGQSRALSLIGLALSVTSGIFMFISAPLHYYANWAFDTKMAILLVALTTYALIFAWRPAQVRAHVTLARLHIAVSLLLWVFVCMAGRAIGFV